METSIVPKSDQPLHQAVERNEIPAIQALLGQGVNANQFDTWGRAPLHYVRSLQAAQILVAHHAEVSLSEQKNPGHTTLHNVVQRNTQESRKIVEFLLSQKAPVNARNKWDTQPLGLVNWEKNPKEMVQLLLQHKAQIKPGTNNEYGYLDQAIFHGQTDLVAILLSFGADPKAITRDSQMLLEGKVAGCDRSKIAALLKTASEQKPH